MRKQRILSVFVGFCRILSEIQKSANSQDPRLETGPRTRNVKHDFFKSGHPKKDYRFEMTDSLPSKHFKDSKNSEILSDLSETRFVGFVGFSDLSDLSEINVRIHKHKFPNYIYFHKKSWTTYFPESQFNRPREICDFSWKIT